MPSRSPTSARLAWCARLACLCLALLALGACRIYRKGEPWSFSLTNELLNEVEHDQFTLANSSCACNANTDSWGPLVCVLIPVLAPIAVDIALLPVTGVHDLCIRRR